MVHLFVKWKSSEKKTRWRQAEREREKKEEKKVYTEEICYICRIFSLFSLACREWNRTKYRYFFNGAFYIAPTRINKGRKNKLSLSLRLTKLKLHIHRFKWNKNKKRKWTKQKEYIFFYWTLAFCIYKQTHTKKKKPNKWNKIEMRMKQKNEEETINLIRNSFRMHVEHFKLLHV